MLNSRPTYGDIGNEGWALLAKAVKLRPDFVTRISCCHHTLREARKEDMFVIWDVVGDVELVHEIDNVNFTRWSGHGAWRRLALVMDMTEDEYTRDFEEEIKKMEEKRTGGGH